ncbi:hypothetical protein K461DRAFT_270913 [Myriangium duriaei CBS 260.36]|uniref:Pre-rRNA-processing protein TSR2 n=1 Tax=Myriangium duriaei CBS 260.36 TaxID=1168546 RepID=A0A9P4ISP5_9PEZI|nr:hypothetical protein K461DRAFT_270913 [Myriangium duriaei CBS 260.36]
MSTSIPATDSGAIAPAPATQESQQTAFDHAIWYLISGWPPMTLALAEQWAGDLTSDKRDWLAGAISELFVDRPDTDAIDVEDVLLQVMADEFEVEVQDESGEVVAREIMRAKEEILVEGRLDAADRVRREFEARKGKKVAIQNAGERSEEVGSDEDVEIDGDGDEDMDDAPSLVPARAPREKEEPEVDEDGFTKVVGRKKR